MKKKMSNHDILCQHTWPCSPGPQTKFTTVTKYLLESLGNTSHTLASYPGSFLHVVRGNEHGYEASHTYKVPHNSHIVQVQVK